MAKKRIKEIRVGGAIILALTMMIIFVFSVGEDNAFFSRKVRYKILFTSTAGLYEGDPVLLTGVEVGNVARISFPEDLNTKKILVEIEIDKEVRNRIREDSRARLASASLVYGKLISVSMGSPEKNEIVPGEFIQAEEGGGYTAFVDSTSLVLDELKSVLAKINRGEGMLGMILNEPLEMRQTFHHLSLSAVRISRLLERVEHGEGALGALMTDTLNIRQTLADLRDITENLKNEKSVLGKLINDETYGQEVMTDLKAAVHAIASITAKIDSGQGTAGRFVNEDELYQGLEDVVLGTRKSRLARWVIQGRRKTGEKERQKLEEQAESENNTK